MARQPCAARGAKYTLAADGRRRSGEAEVTHFYHPLLRYLSAGSFPSRRASNHAGGAVVGAYQVAGVPEAGEVSFRQGW